MHIQGLIRRYVGGIVCGAVLVLLVLHAAAVTLPPPTVQQARWVGEMLMTKATIAASRTDPQLLIAGGSNAHFGFSAETLHLAYGIPSTNVGVHAGLARRYILGWLERLVKKGDLVVLALEYDFYGNERYDNALYHQTLAYDQPYYLSLPVVDKVRLLARITFKDWRGFAINKMRPEGPPGTGYSAKTISAFGDEANNSVALRDPAVIAKLKVAEPRTYRLDSAATADLGAFRRHVENVGARMVLVYPNMLDSALDEARNAAVLAEM